MKRAILRVYEELRACEGHTSHIGGGRMSREAKKSRRTAVVCGSLRPGEMLLLSAICSAPSAAPSHLAVRMRGSTVIRTTAMHVMSTSLPPPCNCVCNVISERACVVQGSDWSYFREQRFGDVVPTPDTWERPRAGGSCTASRSDLAPKGWVAVRCSGDRPVRRFRTASGLDPPTRRCALFAGVLSSERAVGRERKVCGIDGTLRQDGHGMDIGVLTWADHVWFNRPRAYAPCARSAYL